MLTRAFRNASDALEVDGTVTGPPSTTVTVHLFASDACDGSGSGEGARFIYSFTQALDGGGSGSFSRSVFGLEAIGGPADPGHAMTALVIVPDGPTSEHSACFTITNTAPGTGSMVSLTDPSTGTGADLTFDDVSAGGVTTYQVTDTAPAVPSGFEIGDPPVFYDISTTAAFSGNVEVCLRYDEAAIGIPEMDLRLLHYDSGTAMWEDATTTVDLVSNVICGSVTSLSPFAIAHMTTAGVGSGGIRAAVIRPRDAESPACAHDVRARHAREATGGREGLRRARARRPHAGRGIVRAGPTLAHLER